MDTVTESKMAINGRVRGIGIIHRNLNIRQQTKEIAKVKKNCLWVLQLAQIMKILKELNL